MTLEFALCFFANFLDLCLVALLAHKRTFRVLPVFFTSICLELGSGVVGLTMYHFSGFSEWYLRYFLVEIPVDCLLYFCVLVELGKSLLPFNGKSRARWILAGALFGGTVMLTGALSQWAAAPGRSALSNGCLLGLRIECVLQFAGFLALAGWSGLRDLRWPERQLRIACGFGFCTFVWFLVSLLEFRWNTGPAYHRLSEVEQTASLVTLAYWLHGFWLEPDEAGAEEVRRGGLAASDAGKWHGSERQETPAGAPDRETLPVYSPRIRR